MSHKLSPLVETDDNLKDVSILLLYLALTSVDTDVS